jgi:hypothetical protein
MIVFIIKKIKKITAIDFIILFLALCFLFLISTYYNFISDDAFITFRYVKNILRGYGPVYNRGEFVEGFTSPLWLILLTFVSKLGIDTVFAGRFFSLFFSASSIILFYFIVKKLRFSYASILVSLWFFVSSNVIAVWSLGGLEITFYTFALLLSYYCFVFLMNGNKRMYVFMFLLHLSLLLIRLEGVFVVFIFFMYSILKKKLSDMFLYYGVPLGLSLGLIFFLRLQIYHQLFPNTFYVKVGMNFNSLLRGFLYVFQYWWNYGFVILFLFLIGFSLIKKNRASLFTLAFIAAITLETVYVGGDGLPMFRFLLPTIPFWAVLIAMVINSIKCLEKDESLLYYATIFIFFLLITYTNFSYDRIGIQYVYYKDQKNYEIPRWIQVGTWLSQHAQKSDSVALVPIGAVGYYSDLYVYDMLGLVNRHIAHMKVSLGKGWAGHEKHDGQYILSQKPTYLLLGNIQALDQKLDINDSQFVRPYNQNIRDREDDVFLADEVWKYYDKKIADIGNGFYLHYLKLKKE